MKKAVIWTAGLLLLAAAGLAGFVSMQESTTPTGTTLAGMDLSGLTGEQVRARLDSWWLEKSRAVLQPSSRLVTKQPRTMTLAELGIEPDFEATMRGVPIQTYADTLLGKKVEGAPIRIVWTQRGGEFEELKAFVDANAKPRQKASVEFKGGHFTRTYEVPTFTLDIARAGGAALTAMQKQKPAFELPMATGDVRITNEAIDSINVVVKSFSTRFSAGNVNRSHNIRLAAGSLSGSVLMPGDVLSYNETVGRRTPKAGYKEAGVYANGRHEIDFGGGICQVSTTLFNAVALANLEIVSRTNHSMPVPYVPVGRDATVDYDRIDFQFKNSFDTPIAISSEVKGGTITSYVLGSKKLDVQVKMETSDHSSWGNRTEYVTDGSLRPGSTRVIERGSMGRKCTTWRIVEKDGVEISREKMFESIYRASPRIIARGPKAKPKQAAPPVEPTAAPPVEPVPAISGGGGG
jgi:vancomycin resistance protein YoaR